MIDSEKVYLCTVDNLFKAAILYDILSIQNKGLRAKTNFMYTKQECLAVLHTANLRKIGQEENALKVETKTKRDREDSEKMGEI